MICLPLAVILPGCLLFFFQGCWSRSQFSPSADATCISTDYKDEISCLIINLEYVKCNWTKPQMQHVNYTFSSVFLSRPFHECPEYLQEHGQNVGCRIPLKSPDDRFRSFHTKLSVGGNQSVCKNYTDLRHRVKLDPPFNISVNSSGRESEVCVYWSSTKRSCVNHTVGYRKASGPLKISIPVHSSSYCVSPVSSGVMYTFKVRSSMSNDCGPSDFWSDWSEEVQWINKKDVKLPVFWHVLSFILGAILLFILFLVWWYMGQIKVILIPVIPDPSQNLQDLFKKHNGNVESWVYISRELKDAFEPDYTESPCVVCEPSPTLETKTEDGPMEQPVP